MDKLSKTSPTSDSEDEVFFETGELESTPIAASTPVPAGRRRKRPRSSPESRRRTKMTKKDRKEGSSSSSSEVEESPEKSMASFMKEMNKKLTKMNRNIVAIQGSVRDSVATAIAPINAKIEAQGTRIANVERRQKGYEDKLREGLGDQVKEIVDEHLRSNSAKSQEHTDSYAAAASKKGPFNPDNKTPSKKGSSQDDEWFWAARRKLRFFPIPGQTNEDLLDGLDDFIIQKLRIPAGVLDKEDVIYVRKVRSANKSKVSDELLVCFKNVQVRDLVQSYARNLAGWVGGDGKPTAGLRMKIPERLIGSFKALEQYGHVMRSKKGPNFKRHIKIDDTLLCLYMDVFLPKNKEWIRVDMDHVFADNKQRRVKKAKKSNRDLVTANESEVEAEDKNNEMDQ